ncbi:MAG: response regulator, partial [Proteobacteria bacterium]
HIPVHMISALEYQQSALRMGALGYLTKPVTIDKVRSALGRIENLLSEKVRRVLLIEDDERQNLAVSELVAGDDVKVSSVRTGAKAIEVLQKEPFDCIILDLSLPDISGFDLLEQLNGLSISLPPIVIYTGKDLTQEEESYLRRFSESIIIKGARSPERLLDEVNLFLHRVESLLPHEKQEMLSTLRSQDQSFENRTVLLVDDDVRNLFALTSVLETRGLKVRFAKDGIAALEELEKFDDIELVLMDIMMPRMDGLEATKRIRVNPNDRIRKLPVIALTAKAMKDDHEKCIAAGATDYLPKPINLDNLMTVLKVWLSPKHMFS